METPKTTFRLEPRVLKQMDRLITNPPSILLDPARGAPRNRTELVEVLIRQAAEVQAAEKAKE